jgi:hypothetical protein
MDPDVEGQSEDKTRPTPLATQEQLGYESAEEKIVILDLAKCHTVRRSAYPDQMGQLI